MSNVNIGFVDGRMGSRILKPPGGGYSEIFFTDEECKPKKAPQTRTETVIESILRTEEVISKKAETKTEAKTEEEVLEEKVQNLSFEEKHEEVDGYNREENKEAEEKSEPATPEPEIPEEPKIPVLKTPEPKPIENTPRRTRVPPGGFSSALW